MASSLSLSEFSIQWCHDRLFGILISQKMAFVLTSPRITVSWWDTNLIQEFQARYKKYVVQDHCGLGVQHLVANGWGRKRLETSASMGLHFPQEQLTRITPIFARLQMSTRRFRGCRRNAYLQARNLAKTIARDKPVSTFECTRKH